jgi:hypothetical protein
MATTLTDPASNDKPRRQSVPGHATFVEGDADAPSPKP